ncbi:UNVERIFIED_CONTAM: REP element-mobilizing transposase RayT [Acetivibrio alkalicellulosi]
MSRTARIKSKSGIYHIILRGANRQEIFHEDEDRIRFLETLEKYKNKAELKVYAWCLMDNHIHLLSGEGNEDISVTMKRIGVSFVHYYNNKYNTSGHLFQDRFLSENVENNGYFLTVIRYIHQNPIKAGIAEKSVEWMWSSCREYYGKKSYINGLIDKELALGMFSQDMLIAREKFKKFNEIENEDVCTEYTTKRRLSDEEARKSILSLMSIEDMISIKSLPKSKRDEMIKKIIKIEGLSQRQAARILGISPNLIFKI